MKPKILSKAGCLCFLLFFIFLLVGCSQKGQESNPIVPPGWEKYETDEFSLYLPEEWVGASKEEFNKIITELLADPNLEALAQEVDANKDLLSFWAFDEVSAISGEFITNINIMNNKSIFPLKKVMEETNKETLLFLDEMGIEGQ